MSTTYPQAAVTTGVEAPAGLTEREPLDEGLDIQIFEHDERTGLYLAVVDGRRLWLHQDEVALAPSLADGDLRRLEDLARVTRRDDGSYVCSVEIDASDDDACDAYLATVRGILPSGWVVGWTGDGCGDASDFFVRVTEVA